jgi:hypothetical protein
MLNDIICGFIALRLTPVGQKNMEVRGQNSVGNDKPSSMTAKELVFKEMMTA